MRFLVTSYDDGFMPSHSVTSLAHDARRLISGGGGETEAEELIRRIDGLRDQFRESPSAPIHAWLDNLRRQVSRS